MASNPTALLGDRVVEALQQLMRGKLDLFVSPLRGPIQTSDEAHSMNAPEVSIDECVSGLGVVVCIISEPEMPRCVVGPGVPLQERVFLLSSRLDIAPCAFKHVLVGVDQAPCLRNGVRINRV